MNMDYADKLGLVGFATFIIAGIAAITITNLAWAPSAERITLAETQVQIACIEQGGIYAGAGKCYWSKRDPAVSP